MDDTDSNVMRAFYDTSSLFDSWNSLHNGIDFSREELVTNQAAARDALSALDREVGSILVAT